MSALIQLTIRSPDLKLKGRWRQDVTPPSLYFGKTPGSILEIIHTHTTDSE